MTLAEMPAVGSRWRYPGWNNPDWTGPWEVVAVGEPGYESMRAIKLKRVALDKAGDRKIHEADIQFWPGGWVPA
jgi:hypothetical protein